VLTGHRTDEGKVRVYASRDLRGAEFTIEEDWEDRFLEVFPLLINRKITLALVMTKFVMIEADSYAAAMEHLFKTWSPDAAGPAGELERPRPELPWSGARDTRE
jgi:hypothetical protein